MTTYHTIETGNWRIDLPEGWEQGEPPESGGLCFESGDGKKAIYLSTWTAGYDTKTSLEALHSFLAAEEKAFKNMRNSQWGVIRREICNERHATAVLDCYDQSNHYRIVCKLISWLPKVVTFAFHDYECEDYAASNTYSDPIMKSLRLIEDCEDV